MNLPSGWLTDDEASALAELSQDKVVLELGAWKGRSTTAIASTAKHVVSVDWHHGDPDSGAGDTLTEYMTNVRALPNVTIIIGRFETVLPLLAPVFDLVFVDGAHDYQSVLRDARLAVSVGSMVAFHDHNQPPVAQAVSAAGLAPVRVTDSLAVCG